ncbi:phospholipase A, partial [Gammaproteobacteria bacterium]|nr:phospholipase A [Gammaproteobacteria bacterium]
MLRILSLLLLLPLCALAQSTEPDTTIEVQPDGGTPTGIEEPAESLIIERIERERAAEDNRSVLIAHKRNYFLPLTWASNPNDAPYESESTGAGESLENFEAQFQISLKLPIAEGIFTDNDLI